MTWWAEFTNIEKLFWGISIIFSVLFIIQFVISLLGLDFDADADLDVGGDVDGHFEADPGFTIFSVRSFIAFMTFFGWTGVMVLGNGGTALTAVLSATASGGAAMFVVGYIMYLFFRLQQSGTLQIENALGAVGEVYLIIPSAKKGRGKVLVKVQGTLREMDAITDGIELPTGSSIRVVDILENNLLLVEPVEMTSFLPTGD
ncbi:MAG: hypothetical protein AAF502_02575 [Bacteroidota bacterium]